jgi:hypothetical protein
VIACVILEVFVKDLVARAHDDRRTQLHGPPSGFLLPMPGSEGTEAGGDLTGTDQACDTDGAGPYDLGCGAFLVEKDGERNLLVLDESLRISPTSGADGRYFRPGGEDLSVPVSDLTGPLTACQSAEVSKEQNHLRLIAPKITEPLLGPVGIDQNFVCECSCIE